jgi:pimeloyl-ACP methyl ester carboxylesterase
MPDTWQLSLVERKFKDGSIFRMPVFDMLLRSYENFGGDGAELKAALVEPDARRKSLLEVFRGLAGRIAASAAARESEGDLAGARDAYRRSAVNYLAGDWLGIDPAVMAENYVLMLPIFDSYRRLCDPPVEKIAFSLGSGTIHAHFREPGSGGPFPAVLIVQGNDDVKEFNTRIEEAAVGAGFAVLDLDPPGWGESLLTGTVCRSKADYEAAIKVAVDYLEGRADILSGKIGAMGVSFGGSLAPYAAGLEPRIRAAAGLGGPSCDAATMAAIWRSTPALQRRRGYLYSGARGMREFQRWIKGMELAATLSRVEVPVLLVHGEKDSLVPISSQGENAALMEGPVELRIVSGGDHMCNETLLAETAPGMFAWLREKLEAESD